MNNLHPGVVLLLCAGLGAGAAELTRLDGARMVPWRGNDGDSFRIAHADRELTVRLYYVDCPEATAASATDARRVREQTRYFGLPAYDRTLHFAREAAAFTAGKLQRPFTVHTACASAPGRAKERRYYAFVTTHAGEDLAYLLVKHGYARAHGMKRQLPNGTPGKEAAVHLSDVELVAALARRGIWAETDADRLVEFRAAERKEAEELARIEREAMRVFGVVNVNTASAEDLETLTGIGPVLARRIIERRPFSDADDLERVPGISGKTIARLRDHIRFE